MGHFQQDPEFENLTLGDLIDFLRENKLIYVPTYSGSVRVPEGYEDIPVVIAIGNGLEAPAKRLMIAEDEETLYIMEH